MLADSSRHRSFIIPRISLVSVENEFKGHSKVVARASNPYSGSAKRLDGTSLLLIGYAWKVMQAIRGSVGWAVGRRA